jgi:hypothetical protein
MEAYYKTSPLSIALSAMRTVRRLRRGFPKGLPFGSFSWFVLWRVPKNEHQTQSARARRLCERKEDAPCGKKQRERSNLSLFALYQRFFFFFTAEIQNYTPDISKAGGLQ